MNEHVAELTTGLPGLDRALKGILPGDNIVWQVDAVEDYMAVAAPYVNAGLRSGRKVIYFRFASHPPVIFQGRSVEMHELDPADGFETFIARIHAVIEAAGRGALYVFDCLSELAADWYSDSMLANFFMLTCPYLYDLETVAYFALFRNSHSSKAIRPVTETTQLFLELYRHAGALYVHPLKVQFRYSPTMNMLHRWEGEEFRPVTSSVLISSILSSVNWSDLNADTRPGYWERAFLEAQQILDAADSGVCPPRKLQETFDHLSRMIISRDPGMLKLVARYLTLEDVVNIWKRMIGSGLVGGKTVGMLVARSILKQHSPRFADLLEGQDSFYVGSDVFYAYLVRNGVWWLRQKQRHPPTFLEGAVQARQRILQGQFPDYILEQFEQMLDYFGQSPIIVRSSSLLEDNFGNAFSGKYESIFCPNQGSRHRRLEDFLSAVKTVYASAMSEKALKYRAHRGLLDRDEQMSLLVQRVSGTLYGDLFHPQVAGVAFSFNPYVWSPDIDPKAGVLRLVFGLGTRAVDRADDDYTRVVALNAPDKKPEAGFDDAVRYAQRKVDVLDLTANQLTAIDVSELIHRSRGLPRDLFLSDTDADTPQILTFEGLFSQTSFVEDMRQMVNTLEAAYDYPVDVEFAANVFDGNRYRINLLQCRPFQVREGSVVLDMPQECPEDRCVLEAGGPVIGRGRVLDIDRVVFVVPSIYAELTNRERYAIARLIGKITHRKEEGRRPTTLLIGPGRWGTTTPSLGVPVSTAEINTATAVCEVVAMREGLIPDVSLGTHFFNDLVETDMIYFALFPGRDGHRLNSDFLMQAPNRLGDLIPDAAGKSEVLRVIDAADLSARGQLRLYADTYSQKALFCIEPDEKTESKA